MKEPFKSQASMTEGWTDMMAISLNFHLKEEE
jgi:hypothetical protein